MNLMSLAKSKALKALLGSQMNQDAPGNYMGPGNQQFGTSALNPVSMTQNESPLEKKRQDLAPMRRQLAMQSFRGF